MIGIRMRGGLIAMISLFFLYVWLNYGPYVLPFVLLLAPSALFIDRLREWYVGSSFLAGFLLYIFLVYSYSSIDPIGFMWLTLIMVWLYWIRSMKGYDVVDISTQSLFSKIAMVLLISLFISIVVTIYPLTIRFPLIVYLIAIFLITIILIIITRRYISI
jgi:hypothetical protein